MRRSNCPLKVWALAGLLGITASTYGQALRLEDLQISNVNLNVPLSMMSLRLGSADTVFVDHIYDEYLVYRYPGMVVWRNAKSDRVRRIEVQNRSFTTRRGIRIGDPLRKIILKYGNGGKLAQKFDIEGPFSYAFHDYSKVLTYSLGDLHLSFFIQADTVARMLYYVRLTMVGKDWGVGGLNLQCGFGLVTARFGKPDSTVEGDYGSTGYCYPGYVFWRENSTNTLFAMDIYDSSLATSKGLRVGSPAPLVDSLYYDDHEITFPDQKFERAGPYDASFQDYSHWVFYSSGDHCFVVFTQHDKVVKLLFYIGVQE